MYDKEDWIKKFGRPKPNENIQDWANRVVVPKQRCRTKLSRRIEAFMQLWIVVGTTFWVSFHFVLLGMAVDSHNIISYLNNMSTIGFVVINFLGGPFVWCLCISYYVSEFVHWLLVTTVLLLHY